MSDPNRITEHAAVEYLDAGQWVLLDDGTAACLFDTHMGFPQRMWGRKCDGGLKGYCTSFLATDALPLPWNLADLDNVTCQHKRTNECGQCLNCGTPSVREAAPMHFSPEDAELFKAVAEHNSRIEANPTP